MPTTTLALTDAAACRRAWPTLAAPPADLAGRFRAELLGPRWMQAVTRFALSLRGFAGWEGKAFDGRGAGTNLMRRDGALRDLIPMRLDVAPSALDGRPALYIRYPAGTLWPWPHVVDELRVADETTLLGMTHLARGPVVAFPFLLRRWDA